MKAHRVIWPWIATALVGAVLLYPLSFGPACWIGAHAKDVEPLVVAIYTPLARLCWAIPEDCPHYEWPINALWRYSIECDAGWLGCYICMLGAPPPDPSVPRF